MTYCRYIIIQICCFLYKKFETIKEKVHRGKILQDAVKKTGLDIKFIAQKAGYERVTYYTHVKKENLSFKILDKYSKAIGYDFSGEIPGMSPFIVEEDGHIYSKEPTSFEEAVKQRNEWKEKYYALMEKYQRLLEKE